MMAPLRVASQRPCGRSSLIAGTDTLLKGMRGCSAHRSRHRMRPLRAARYWRIAPRITPVEALDGWSAIEAVVIWVK